MSNLDRGGDRPRRPPEDPWWDYAHRCAKALREGREDLPAHPMHGLLLEPGETVRSHAPAQYSRLQRGPTAQRGGRQPVMAYNPVMMMGSMAVQGIADARRNRQESKQSQLEWRLTRPAMVLTTTERVMCNRPDGGWLSFWYRDLAEHHIDLPNRTMVMAFAHDQCAPVRLQGPAAPAIALWSSVGVYGDAWKADPRLSALSTPSPASQQRLRDANARNARDGRAREARAAREAAREARTTAPGGTHDLTPDDHEWAQEQAQILKRIQQEQHKGHDEGHDRGL